MVFVGRKMEGCIMGHEDLIMLRELFVMNESLIYQFLSHEVVGLGNVEVKMVEQMIFVLQ